MADVVSLVAVFWKTDALGQSTYLSKSVRSLLTAACIRQTALSVCLQIVLRPVCMPEVFLLTHGDSILRSA